MSESTKGARNHRRLSSGTGGQMILAFTLRGQVRRYCTETMGWGHGVADDCADLAVEIVGSNWPIFDEHDMSCVLAEVCCAPGEPA